MCGNIICGNDYSNKWRLSQFCCGCTVRTGSLIIGWFELIATVLWVIMVILGKRSATNYIGIGSLVITLIAAVCILIGVYKDKVKLVWIATVIQLIIAIWSLVVTILFFVNLLWSSGIISVLQMLLCLYFFLVVRSQGYDMEGCVATSPA